VRALAAAAIAGAAALGGGCGGATGGGGSCGVNPVTFQGAGYHEEGSGMLTVADVDTGRQLAEATIPACDDAPGQDPGPATTYRLYAIRGVSAGRALAGVAVEPDRPAQPADPVALWVHGVACGSSDRQTLLACLHRDPTAPIPMY